MKQEDKHATIDQSKKMQELGIVIETEKVWVLYDRESTYGLTSTAMARYRRDIVLENIPAPDVTELGGILPFIITIKDEEYHLVCSSNNNKYFPYSVSYRAAFTQFAYIFIAFGEKTEAQARAAAVIWLKENGYLEENK